MKEYQEPVVSVIELGVDIITTSRENPIETQPTDNILPTVQSVPTDD